MIIEFLIKQENVEQQVLPVPDQQLQHQLTNIQFITKVNPFKLSKFDLPWETTLLKSQKT